MDLPLRQTWQVRIEAPLGLAEPIERPLRPPSKYKRIRAKARLLANNLNCGWRQDELSGRPLLTLGSANRPSAVERHVGPTHGHDLVLTLAGEQRDAQERAECSIF